MEILNTDNITEWLDALNCDHSLKLNVIECKKHNFHAQMDILTNISHLDVQFAEVQALGYTANFIPEKSKPHNDAFLITHSFNQFSGIQGNRNINVQGSSFSLDLSLPFQGRYVSQGHSKALVIPFDIISASNVDFLKKHSFERHHFYLTIDTILKSISTNDKDADNIRKTKAIIDLLSIDNISEQNSTIDYIRFFVDKCIASGKNLNLDILSDQFFMSRRKMQYTLANHGLTYRKLIEESKKRLR